MSILELLELPRFTFTMHGGRHEITWRLDAARAFAASKKPFILTRDEAESAIMNNGTVMDSAPFMGTDSPVAIFVKAPSMRDDYICIDGWPSLFRAARGVGRAPAVILSRDEAEQCTIRNIILL